jgi:hypothetical protein
MSLTDVTGLIAAMGAVLAAVGAIVLLFFAAKQTQEMLKSRRAQYLPLVIPETDPALRSSLGAEGSEEFFAGAPPSSVAFHNIGTGPAFNVRAVCFGPRPTSSELTLASRRTAVFTFPLRAGVTDHGDESEGNSVIRGEDSIDGNPEHAFYAPATPSQGDVTLPDIASILARYTITYRDIEGRRHASQFDFDSKHHWHYVGSFDISKDLQELQRKQKEANAAAQDAHRQGY